MLDEVALAYGGFDSICVTAGVFWPSDTTGHIPDDKWAFTFGVNVTGSYIVGDEAFLEGRAVTDARFLSAESDDATVDAGGAADDATGIDVELDLAVPDPFEET